MNANTDSVSILRLRSEVLQTVREIGQRPGQVFYNYFLTKGQQDYARERYPELYHVSTKEQFTVWLYANVIDTDPITLRSIEPPAKRAL